MTTISYRWDTTDPANVGWYYEIRNAAGEVVDDSVKAWAGVDVDAFAREQATELEAALRDAYPSATVEAA